MESFTKQGKLAWEHDTKKAQMGGDISAGDLLSRNIPFIHRPTQYERSTN